MSENERSLSLMQIVHAITTIDQDIRGTGVENVGEIDDTLAGRLARVVTVFEMIRPLLVILTRFPILPATSRTAVSALLTSLDALTMLALPGDADDVADFKAGRDL